MPKWAKFLIGLMLLPVCVGAGLAIGQVARVCGAADKVWAAFFAGAGCWLLIFCLLPKPMLVYVFGHELTHVLWTWAMGGKVSRFRASARGGQVVVSKSNFLTSLAPYFFPLYALLVAVVFWAGDRIWGWSALLPFFHLVLGAAYAFHLTLTLYVLQGRQSDVTEHGYLFSWVVIFLGNALVLLIGIPLLAARVSVAQALTWWWEHTNQLCLGLASALSGGWFQPGL